ncbi:NADH dehydrogenase I subunit J (plasmid) [Legionella adelaidensis]|uniref:NADH-quinone oxidoreductase subunit J n=1 Tax=Legionella adelaidensis TaxID=45056 RepID=A0A0W0R0E1_9GAMM|nr:NADH-quinone oxidoreductase subunit J [Legionella adelaidensis]KTC64560.1 NADH-quinone oxidoreductase chain J [Legionella adelaidensis]VEH85928.1 NADH dehydrogenase I subunit J [Legionella adelaidensis]
MSESIPQIIFYVFAALATLSAILVITQNNPVRCVLFLVVTFFASSVLWILVGAEFLALILVLVYVGAVMTLFLFVVMMLNIDIESMKKHFIRHLPLGLVIVALLVGLLVYVIPKESFQTDVETIVEANQIAGTTVEADISGKLYRPVSNTENLGLVLYTNYVFAFEIAAVVLLVAIIAAITLVHRAPIRSKRQNIVQQIMTRRDERITLVKMESDK